MKKPTAFLDVRINDLASTPGLSAMCAGYELGKWRAEALAAHAFEWLPEFALTERELRDLTQANAVEMLRRAAAVVYTTEKYKRRGEFGELLLHICLRQLFDTYPAISKIYYKDSPNDVVKGFDAVHVVANNDSLELWLGEAKFYSDISSAISDACIALRTHSERDFMRTEFAAIINKIDPEWPHAARLKKLLSPGTSLDQVFDVARFPALITYDSPTIANHQQVSAEFEAAFDAEAQGHHQAFAQKVPKKISIHLFLLPLRTKQELVEALQKRLEAWQAI